MKLIPFILTLHIIISIFMLSVPSIFPETLEEVNNNGEFLYRISWKSYHVITLFIFILVGILRSSY